MRFVYIESSNMVNKLITFLCLIILYLTIRLIYTYLISNIESTYYCCLIIKVIEENLNHHRYWNSIMYRCNTSGYFLNMLFYKVKSKYQKILNSLECNIYYLIINSETMLPFRFLLMEL